MSKKIMIAGNSGTGKTTSFRNLDPATTFIVNCGKKDLSFRGARNNYKNFDKATLKGNLLNTNNFETISTVIPFVAQKLPHIKTLIIDDFQFTMAASVMKNIAIKGYDKWNELANGIWKITEAAVEQRDDLTIVFIEHLDVNYDDSGIKQAKAKTVGKLFDNAVNLDGLFTVILYSEAVKDLEGKIQYVFRTRTNGTDTCKTPMDMFDEEYIPNDLRVVLNTMNEYYGSEEPELVK